MTEVVPRRVAPRPRPASATFGGIGAEQPGVEPPAGPDFAALHAGPEFTRLRARFRRFAFALTALFLLWYLGYVLLAAYAHELMAIRLTGSITVGLALGLLQFASTIAITALYVRWARRRLDPAVAALRADAGVDR
ncbi:DUF485 domain-containing protein [Actinokineospora enzanensis]|uniref:DUF485 domain-containing protein n=1 Tax=Actinokineospora enzanensis TaxID=155975 RepID=UPI000371D309|nr:DUF485 domain-containing protein [Actinokineospora enzanensis]